MTTTSDATATGHGSDVSAAVLDALAPWRAAGVLSDADAHVAATLCRLTGTPPEPCSVPLAAALAVRAPRLGHTCLDLTTVATSAAAEVEGDRGLAATTDVDELDWPSDPGRWADEIAASAMVGEPEAAPLVLDGSRLYLERYWDFEQRVADELVRRAGVEAGPSPVTDPRRQELLEALVPLAPGESAATSAQWAAAASGASRPLSVIVGGPGTGKTRTVAALLTLLLDADTGSSLQIALAAPTGKAAARMGEAFRDLAQRLRASGLDGAEGLAARLEASRATTIHALLGARPGTVRVRHHRDAPLVADIVIVDETSMVSLPLMARLLDALRPDAHLVLVGDPGQLASVEAGSVLGDIAGPAADAAAAGAAAPEGPVAGCVTVLSRSFRFPAGSAIDRVARAVRAGEVATALELLGSAVAEPDGADPGVPGVVGGSSGAAAGDSDGSVAAPGSAPAHPGSTAPATPGGARPGPVQQSLDLDLGGGPAAPAAAVPERSPELVDPGSPDTGSPDTPSPDAPPGGEAAGEGVRLEWVAEPGDGPAARRALAGPVAESARAIRRAAEADDVDAALAELTARRILCAHRRGPFGVVGWNGLVEQWLTADRALASGFYLGRPVLVTANDRANGLFNGDLGVVVRTPTGAKVAFPGSEGTRLVAPVRLDAIETVHAMTIHKSQGSEFDHVVVVLPPPESRLATRELLYTAITRARRRVTLVGTAESVERAVTQRVVRASGLRDRLWGA